MQTWETNEKEKNVRFFLDSNATKSRDAEIEQSRLNQKDNLDEGIHA